jgi:hypothetical protein
LSLVAFALDARRSKQQHAATGDGLMPTQRRKEGGFPRSGGTEENGNPRFGQNTERRRFPDQDRIAFFYVTSKSD